jgi:imidazole glycerol-phosphate synthase subunit HisH
VTNTFMRTICTGNPPCGNQVRAIPGRSRSPRILWALHGPERRVEMSSGLEYDPAVIALIDYGAGNLHSVEKALRYLGADVRRVTEPGRLQEAESAVLPGVGAFDDCVNALKKQEMFEGTRAFIQSGRPFLGICVGYQALFETSDEFNSCAAGLGIFPGKVVRFAGKGGLKVPQIGWNQLEVRRPDCPLFRNIPSGSYTYFVHSFFPEPVDRSIVAAETEYGQTFASAIWRDNVYATQFHPEKSQKVGLQLLQNFVDLARG